MTRCFNLFTVGALRRATAWMLSALIGALLLATAAHAQAVASRQFPANVKRGVMTVTAPPEVQINGTAMRLSPGVRIRGPNNLLLMSGALIGQQYAVNYVLEQQGLVREVWILSQAEVDQLPRGWDTTTNFVFGSDADKPKVDDGKTPFDQLPKFPKQ
jgi:hypothetical protein